ncbi:hypothetical protein FRB95_005425 [Tulasnella sp. JGI-2019a]|nr:hypothetical protein FRB95_005425 [Tulasnella sp. JGI-2019a]
MPSTTKASSRSPVKSSKVNRDDSASIQGDDEVASKQGDEEDDDDEREEDEFDIEYILEAKKGKVTPGNWGFFVKWKGYGESENSWVDEPDFFAKDMIDQYWDDHPDIKGNPKSRRVSSAAKPRKSESGSRSQLAKSTSSRSAAKSSVRKSPVVTSEDDEPATKKKSSKRKTAPKEESDDDGDAAMEDVEPAPKKSRKSTSTKKKTISPSPAGDENGLVSRDDSEDEQVGHNEDVAEKYKNRRSWEDLVAAVDTVELGADNVLVVYFTTTKDEKGMVASTIFNAKAPQKMIEFYESHLRWRKTQEEDAETEKKTKKRPL